MLTEEQIKTLLYECDTNNEDGELVDNLTFVKVEFDNKFVTIEAGESGARVFYKNYDRSTAWLETAERETISALKAVDSI